MVWRYQAIPASLFYLEPRLRGAPLPALRDPPRQAPFAVTLPGGAPGPREPGLAAVQAPHRALLLLSLLHLWLLLLAWPAYARRRVPVLLAMRGCRLLMHAWQVGCARGRLGFHKACRFAVLRRGAHMARAATAAAARPQRCPGHTQ